MILFSRDQEGWPILAQKISVAIQRGNAARFLGTIAEENFDAWISFIHI